MKSWAPVTATALLGFSILFSIVSLGTMGWSVSRPESNIGVYVGLFQACTYRLKIGQWVVSEARDCFTREYSFLLCCLLFGPVNEAKVIDVARLAGATASQARDLYIGVDAVRGLMVATLLASILALVTGAIFTATSLLASFGYSLLAIPVALSGASALGHTVGLGIWALGVDARGLNDAGPMLSTVPGYSFALSCLAVLATWLAVTFFSVAIALGKKEEGMNRSRYRAGSVGASASASASAMASYVPVKRTSITGGLNTTVRGGLLHSSTTASSSSNPGSGSSEGMGMGMHAPVLPPEGTAARRASVEAAC